MHIEGVTHTIYTNHPGQKNSHLVYTCRCDSGRSELKALLRKLSESSSGLWQRIVTTRKISKISQIHTRSACALFKWYLISSVLEVFQPNGFIRISITHKSEKKKWINERMIEWRETWPPMDYLTFNMEDETRRHNKYYQECMLFHIMHIEGVTNTIYTARA